MQPRWHRALQFPLAIPVVMVVSHLVVAFICQSLDENKQTLQPAVPAAHMGDEIIAMTPQQR